MKRCTFAMVVVAFFGLSCSKKTGGNYAGTIAGLKQYFDDIKAAHFSGNLKKKANLTKAGLPSLSDWKAVLTSEGYDRLKKKKIKKALERFAGSKARMAYLFRVRKDRSAYYVNKATTEQLQSGKHKLPGGMTYVAKYLKPGLTWVRLKMVKPGRKLGMAYTAFSYVGGRWVFFPKPWRFIRRK